MLKIEMTFLMPSWVSKYASAEFDNLEGGIRNSFPTCDSYIERNVFRNIPVCCGVISDHGGLTTYTYIRNNHFLRSLEAESSLVIAIRALGATIIENSSFSRFKNEDLAVELKDRHSLETDITAVSNYWGTTDRSLIDEMIKVKLLK